MDQKETDLLATLRWRIASGTFSEPDVMALLMLVREHAAANSCLRELAHFVAHRKRDRGLLLSFTATLEAYLAAPTSPGAPFDAPLSVPALERDLNALLGSHSIEPFSPQQVQWLVVTSASILHGCELALKQPHGPNRLSFGFNDTLVGLFAEAWAPRFVAIAPVFAVRNVFFEPVHAHEPSIYWLPQGVPSVHAKNGTLYFGQGRPAA